MICKDTLEFGRDLNDDTICVPNASRAVVPVLMNRLGFKCVIRVLSAVWIGWP